MVIITVKGSLKKFLESSRGLASSYPFLEEDLSQYFDPKTMIKSATLQGTKFYNFLQPLTLCINCLGNHFCFRSVGDFLVQRINPVTPFKENLPYQ